MPLFSEWLDVALFFGDASVLFVVAGTGREEICVKRSDRPTVRP